MKKMVIVCKTTSLMKILEKSTTTMKLLISNEDDTIGNLLVDRLSKSPHINFASYKRSHYLEKPPFIELQYVLKKPDDFIEKYFIQCLDQIDSEVKQIIKSI